MSHQYKEIPQPLTKLQQNHMIVRKVNALYDLIEKSDGDLHKVRSAIAVLGGPLIDPSDYSSVETCIELIKFLKSYPRSGGIT